ncbi:receptor-type tyrosine-protein phosphatase eta-like [Anoplopoma fimbria]|uniref:receptor-type tyrosine-protein phosphatase eta-like n=1 Tax=Anoplopoma fimbria TaxID=229290 RepID=UPI0023EC2DB6|nr:receptor-type tyrosine-protein phosphatase eta-like [Anoplopoma fimbria]
MGKFSAEQDYFFRDWRNLTWDEARNHCQVCFKELVTVTPVNIKAISQNLTSDCWVGLRKNFSTTNHSSMPWSHWADGEPLIFQNWYPATETASSDSDRDSASDSDSDRDSVSDSDSDRDSVSVTATETETASASETATSTNFTGLWESNTQIKTPTTAAPTMPVESDCVCSSMLPPEVSETTVNFTEDSCVAMLSFGAWVEKNCFERLSFICYEDRFIGQANVTKITNESVVLTWQPGPGTISRYRVKVKELKTIETNSLTYDLVSLMAGTCYSVQVFPVKCERDLNPQEVVFYTTPNKVENLKVINVTETSVSLSWNKPAGNVSFYLIKVEGDKPIRSDTEGKEVGSLIPGQRYTFTVLSGVADNKTHSEESNITQHTKPGRVSNLGVYENTKNSLLLSWMKPEGHYTGFRVKAMTDSNDELFHQNVTKTEVTVTGLPMSTKITLSVTALTASDTLEGDTVTVVNYTAPGPISDLVLGTESSSIHASWKSPGGNSLSFTVELQLDGKHECTVSNLTEPMMYFYNLKAAANYTVIVSTFSGHLEGPQDSSSSFTKLVPPSNASVISSDKNQISFQWTPPDNTAKVHYRVQLSASFWGYNQSKVLHDETKHTFVNLKSGTKYDFEVRTLLNEDLSDAAVVSHCTESEKREISLSMMCSSATSLLCDETTTRDDVFEQLKNHFGELLGDSIVWKLEKRVIESKGAIET